MPALMSPESVQACSETEHVMIRLVQPGSWQPCAHCHEPIDFVPGADLAQATSKTFVDDSVRRVRHYHEACFRTLGHLYGDPLWD